MNSSSVIAVDLGGTNLRAAKIDLSGRVLERAKQETPPGATDPSVITNAIIKSIHDCAQNQQPIEKVAVVVPGSIDSSGERIIKAPNLPCLDNFEMKKSLAGALGVEVILENDANAAAVGESWLGAAQGWRSIVCLTLGTGVGGGIILDGKLWRGVDGSAGEIGHTTVEPASDLKCHCGNTGCLELFASATAITRMTRIGLAQAGDSTLNGQELTARKVYEAGVKGDKLALKVFKSVGTYLGIAIANLVNILNPEMIVIAGGVANAWPLFQATTQQEVLKRAFPLPARNVRIVPTACGDDAGLFGAARLAMYDTLSDKL